MNKPEFEQAPPGALAELKKSLGSVPKLSECDQCGKDIGQLKLASLTIKYTAYEFCGDVCLEEWLDVQQD